MENGGGHAAHGQLLACLRQRVGPEGIKVRRDGEIRANVVASQGLLHERYGGRVIGICGGMQMLGTRIDDPHGVEGPAGSTDALGFLDLHTVLQRQKQLRNVAGHLVLGPAFSPVPSAVMTLFAGTVGTTGPIAFERSVTDPPGHVAVTSTRISAVE